MIGSTAANCAACALLTTRMRLIALAGSAALPSRFPRALAALVWGIRTFLRVSASARQFFSHCGYLTRPKLAEALKACRLQGAKLIIAKLDRLARNVAFISNLMESKVEFEAVDFPQANRLTIHIMAAIAEHEAKMISDRTRAALAAARARGKRLGGFRGRAGTAADCAKARRAKSLAAKSRAADLAPVIEDIRIAGAASLRSIAKELNGRGISAPRGGNLVSRASACCNGPEYRRRGRTDCF